MTVGYIAVAIPARTVRVSQTTLFRVAADFLGDALLWTRIALLNGLTDPWIGGQITTLYIPRAQTTLAVSDGILGSFPLSVAGIQTEESATIAAAITKPALTVADLNALLPFLPTSIPDEPGVLWNNGQVISIS